jgi:DNA topoisomerase I
MHKYKAAKAYKFNKGSSKYLLIVESPSKCGKIESFLGSLYKCISSKGHLRHLDTYKDYNVQYKIMEDKESHVVEMKKIIDQYDKENIILASDDDREGEAIAWHICDIFGLDVTTTKRIIFNEITRSALLEAVQNPKTVNMKLVQSQIARQVLDVIIGYKISPYLWKYAYNDKNNSLSAGRCQTPALRLIFDNHREKLSKKMEKDYKVVGYFTGKNVECKLNKSLSSEDECIDFLTKSKEFVYTVNVGELKESKRRPSAPLNTSSLLQLCNSSLNLSPKDTMSLAQILYQEGYITYMRTENRKYSKDFLKAGEEHIKLIYGEKYVGNMDSLAARSDNPHEAIRVTNIEQTAVEKDGKLKSLYGLIYKCTLESLMSDAVYDVCDIKINAPNDMHYKYVIEVPKFLGFRVFKEKSLNAAQTEAYGLLNFFRSIKEVKHNKVNCVENYSNHHSHYNESSLINKLESLEIGRPSTYATFVDTIVQRKYVKKMDIEGEKYDIKTLILSNKEIIFEATEKIVGQEKNKLVIQPIGILIMEFLLQHFEELFSYGYTKHMEEKLDVIVKYAENWTEICEECERKIKDLSKSLKHLTKEVYDIDENHVFMFSKNGAVLRTKDAEPVFKSVKKIQIDLEKLKEGAYTLDDLLETDTSLGIYEGVPLYLKNGKYGYYLSWGSNTKAVKLRKPAEKVTFDDIKYVFNEPSTSNIIREINTDLSVRKGKYGLYIYYKTEKMLKPQFINTKNFRESLLYCKKSVLLNWLEENYNITI